MVRIEHSSSGGVVGVPTKAGTFVAGSYDSASEGRLFVDEYMMEFEIEPIEPIEPKHKIEQEQKAEQKADPEGSIPAESNPVVAGKYPEPPARAESTSQKTEASQLPKAPVARKETKVETLDKACTEGSAHACYRLGRMYRNGKGVERDIARARAYFEKACEDRYENACSLMRL